MMVHSNFHFSNDSLGLLGFDQYKGVEESKEEGPRPYCFSLNIVSP